MEKVKMDYYFNVPQNRVVCKLEDFCFKPMILLDLVI
jgi:hypothetical protein